MFETKTGIYEDRPHIWNPKSRDLANGLSYSWHKKNSLKGLPLFGKFACLVCSKILGIGSAERSWGDTKQIKAAKRSHLGGVATEMQTTIYGASCIRQSQIRQDAARDDPFTNKDTHWTDDDLKGLGLDRFGINADENVRAPVRYFNAWYEDWEQEVQTKNDPVVEEQFNAKYKGLKWYDYDEELNYECDGMEFRSERGQGRGWYVHCLSELYDPEASEKMREKHSDVWPFFREPDFYYMIIKHYKRSPDPSIVIVEQPDNSEDEAGGGPVDESSSDNEGNQEDEEEEDDEEEDEEEEDEEEAKRENSTSNKRNKRN